MTCPEGSSFPADLSVLLIGCSRGREADLGWVDMVLRVCSFESRREAEMRSLIERWGGAATIAPSMREIPLTENGASLAFGEQLLAGQFDWMIFLTGIGTRALWEVLETAHDRAQLFAALGTTKVAVRGPKPLAVLREWGVRVDVRAPEPNTWRELLAALVAAGPIANQRMAIQEYGKPSAELAAALTELGAQLTLVPVYRWALPEDLNPLRSAIQATIDGKFDALLFTSAQQLVHVLEVAAEQGCTEQWLLAARSLVIGSIGPTCSEMLVEHGLPVSFEPSHPKMGTLVKELFERGPQSPNE